MWFYTYKRKPERLIGFRLPNCDHSRWDRSSLLLSLFCWCLPRRRSSSTRPLGVKAKLNWEQEKKKEQKHHKTLCLCAERTYKEPPPPHDDLIGSNLASRRRRVHANGLPVSTQLPAWCNTKSKGGIQEREKDESRLLETFIFVTIPLYSPEGNL